MAIFNTGNGIVPNYGYGYNNGNVTSSTTMVNGVMMTQNVINLGGNSACSNGPSYCQEGYSIYVPCLKNITRGQKVCFEMYITDKENEDTLDLSDLCGLTLELTGPFGCPYDTYTWPDDITVLQRDELSEIQCERFDGDTFNVSLGFYEVDLKSKNLMRIPYDDVNNQESELDYNVDVRGVIGDFYKGEKPTLSAYDSPTHIFVGWTTQEIIDDVCSSFLINDLVISIDNVFEWEDEIDGDVEVIAVYRRRETYEVGVSFNNRHSYFNVTFNGETTMLSDKQRDFVTVTEGYHFQAECKPLTTKDINGNIEKTYIFYNWEDGNKNQVREYFATDDLFKKEPNGTYRLRLMAFCENLMSIDDEYNLLPNKLEPTEDVFYTNLPEFSTLEPRSTVFNGSDNIDEYDNVLQVYNPDGDIRSYISILEGGYIKFNTAVEEGSMINVVLNIRPDSLEKYFPKIRPLNFELKDGIKPVEPVGKIVVKNGTTSKIVEITSLETNEFTFEFDSCETDEFEIYSSFDSLDVENICIFEKIIVDKGKIQLCIPPEDTIKFHSGVLNVNGAICVNDNWWGMESTQLGVVNRINPISIVENNNLINI